GCASSMSSRISRQRGSWARNTAGAPSSTWRGCGPSAVRILEVAAVLPAHLEEGVGDLAERADANGVHEHGEDVLVAHHGLTQPLEHGAARVAVSRLELAQPLELGALLLLGRADELELLRRPLAAGIAERVHPDDRMRAIVL